MGSAKIAQKIIFAHFCPFTMLPQNFCYYEFKIPNATIRILRNFRICTVSIPPWPLPSTALPLPLSHLLCGYDHKRDSPQPGRPLPLPAAPLQPCGTISAFHAIFIAADKLKLQNKLAALQARVNEMKTEKTELKEELQDHDVLLAQVIEVPRVQRLGLHCAGFCCSAARPKTLQVSVLTAGLSLRCE